MYSRFKLAPWWRSNPVIGEVISGLMLWAWGLILAHPANTFAVSRAYDQLAAIFTEQQWTAICLSVALIQSAGVCGEVKWCRPLGAYLAMAVWCFSAVMFGLADIWKHAPFIYGILALSQAYALIIYEVYDGRHEG